MRSGRIEHPVQRKSIVLSQAGISVSVALPGVHKVMNVSQRHGRCGLKMTLGTSNHLSDSLGVPVLGNDDGYGVARMMSQDMGQAALKVGGTVGGHDQEHRLRAQRGAGLAQRIGWFSAHACMPSHW